MNTKIVGFVPQVERQNWVEIARGLAQEFGMRAADYDESGDFVAENYRDLGEHELFSAGIPEELGGGGASSFHTITARLLSRKAARVSFSDPCFGVVRTSMRWRLPGQTQRPSASTPRLHKAVRSTLSKEKPSITSSPKMWSRYPYTESSPRPMTS